jgi:hypothetical protein
VVVGVTLGLIGVQLVSHMPQPRRNLPNLHNKINAPPTILYHLLLSNSFNYWGAAYVNWETACVNWGAISVNTMLHPSIKK